MEVAQSMVIVSEWSLASPNGILTPFIKATVLLNANVALLAIPAVAQPPIPLVQNKAQIFSYASIATSLVSIASGYAAQHAGWANLGPQCVSQVCIYLHYTKRHSQSNISLDRVGPGTSSFFLPCRWSASYGRESAVSYMSFDKKIQNIFLSPRFPFFCAAIVFMMFSGHMSDSLVTLIWVAAIGIIYVLVRMLPYTVFSQQEDEFPFQSGISKFDRNQGLAAIPSTFKLFLSCWLNIHQMMDFLAISL